MSIVRYASKDSKGTSPDDRNDRKGISEDDEEDCSSQQKADREGRPTLH